MKHHVQLKNYAIDKFTTTVKQAIYWLGHNLDEEEYVAAAIQDMLTSHSDIADGLKEQFINAVVLEGTLQAFQMQVRCCSIMKKIVSQQDRAHWSELEDLVTTLQNDKQKDLQDLMTPELGAVLEEWETQLTGSSGSSHLARAFQAERMRQTKKRSRSSRARKSTTSKGPLQGVSSD